MITPTRVSALVGALLFAGAAHAAGPALPGAIFTTDKNGTVVNGNTKYLGKCGDSGVYLDGGPGPNAPEHAASLPDGDYYFQVTDPSGKTLLSTDPVRNRCFTVSGGLIVGVCPTGTHETYVDEDMGGFGARTVELCAPPDTPFLATPGDGGVYKVWVTPAEAFAGDADSVDSSCDDGVRGCFHGFLASQSKTDTFKVRDVATYCITVEKQVVSEFGTNPGVGWEIHVTDSLGIVNTFYTDDTGSTGNQICGLLAGSYLIAETLQDNTTQLAVLLDGQVLGTSAALVAVGSGTDTPTVQFINQLTGQN